MTAKDRKLTQLSDAELQAALADCAAEPVHIPGRTQPHGAMLGVHPDTMTVCYASENASDILGLDPQTLFRGTLRDHLAPELRHTLANVLRTGAPEGEVSDIGPVRLGERDLWVSSAPAYDYGILQFEPLDRGVAQADAIWRDLSFLTRQIEGAEDTQDLFDRTVDALRTLMGYDRVLVYKFDADFNGSVVAEDVSPDLEPYLGLNFPKWDIPEQARAIMGRIPMRYIADVDAEPSPVLKAHPVLPDLDMTAATLRGVSPVHLEYLRNMGHLGTLTLHLRHQGALWGVISLMHGSPRKPAQRQRQLCLQFARLFEAKLGQLIAAERMIRVQAADALRKTIANGNTDRAPGDVFEKALLQQLRDAMQADGAAMVLNDHLVLAGDTPPQAPIGKILASPDEIVEGVFASSALAQDWPTMAETLGPAFPGLLLVPLPDRITFAFFRRGRDETVAWAGAPEKAVEIVDGRARIQPRGSFSTYRMLVKGTAAPWDDQAMRLADDLWALLVTAERRDLVEKTNRQQKILINELNHRVRNILALIRSLSQQTLTHNGSIESYVRALEARIAAVAAAHDLGAEGAGTSVTVGQIVQVEAAPYNALRDRVAITGADMGLREDLAPLFALVIHELMTNAVKYGALSNADGRVAVTLRDTDHEFIIDWSESGGPPVVTGRRSGFGTTLIETSVPYELGGHVDIDFAPNGVQATIRLPKSVMVSRTALRSGQPLTSIAPPPPDVSGRALVTGPCLLVEDNFVVSLDTKAILKQVGFREVEAVSSVADALAKLGSFAPSLAILDVNLGNGETSIPVAQALRERGIPFLFVTGYGEVAPIPGAYCDVPILKKPVRKDEFARVIDGMSP
jgi:light-regulated signal transduction histidine kinase (bacteriophytochrome)/CheY-like chemotaxis protein